MNVIATSDGIGNHLVDGLIQVHADSYLLYVRTQNFHWNVQGPFFSTLHALFESQYQELAQAIDEIAERIRALGVIVPASCSHYAATSCLGERLPATTWRDMLTQLAEGHRQVSAGILEILPLTAGADDSVTADLLTRRLEQHDKARWMLHSTLQ